MVGDDKYDDDTNLCHDGDEYFKNHGAIVPPLYQNSLFAFENWDALDSAFDKITESYVYSRLMNPTVEVVEKKIAALCRGEKAKLCASGMSAISSSILHFVSSGDHIITLTNIYGPANNFIGKYLKEKMNISVTYIRGDDIEEFKKAINEKTKLIYLESPVSMTFELQNIQAVTELAKSRQIKTIIDNTWSSPMFQKPLQLGVDIEVHSVSKYICGHSDVVAGVVIGKTKDVDQIIINEHALLGGKMAPFEAWLILRSLRTLPLRMKRHHETSLVIAQYLEEHENVVKVNFPGLKSFKQYQLGKKQMNGYGGLMSIELRADDIDQVKSVVNSFQLFKLGVSWGGHESLVYAPSISYVKELSPEKFKAMKIKVGLIRLSIGLENPDDLISDLEEALKKIKAS